MLKHVFEYNSSGNLVRRTSNSSSNNNSSDDDKQYYYDGSELIKTEPEPEPKQDRRGELRSLKSGGKNSTFDFLQDNLKDMTGARRLALKLLNKKWYNPHAGEVVKDDTRNQYKKTGTDQTSWAGSHSHNSSTTTFDFDGAVINNVPGYGFQYPFGASEDGGALSKDNIIIPSVTPAVFELRNPNRDIYGRVI